MSKIFRFFLPLVILLGMIIALSLESRMQLSTSGHGLAQMLIVTTTCWLAWNWISYDEMSNLREVRSSEPVRYHYRLTTTIEDAETPQAKLIVHGHNGTQNTVRDRVLQTPVRKIKIFPVHLSPAHFAHALMSVGIISSMTAVMYLIGVRILGEGVIALLYLVPIGWCTVRWGKFAGVTAAATAALSFDYLFIPPYGTFHIGSPEGWLLLMLFIGIAIRFVGRIQSILTEERQRERKATFLYEFVAAISSQATREEITQTVSSHIQDKFLAEGVRTHLIGGWGYQAFTAYGDQRQASMPDRKPDRVLTIIAGATQIGEIDIWRGTIPLPSEDDPMLQTMLRQIAAALDRVRVAEGKAPYPQQKPFYSEGNSLQTSNS